MLIKTINYTDFLGNNRKEDFCFNYSKADTNRLMFSTKEGLQKFLKRIIREEDNTKLFGFMEEFILNAYGEISDDGRRFIKSPELSKAFKETNAYSELLDEFIKGGDEAFAEFVKGVIPKDMIEEMSDENSKPADISLVKNTENK